MRVSHLEKGGSRSETNPISHAPCRSGSNMGCYGRYLAHFRPNLGRVEREPPSMPLIPLIKHKHITSYIPDAADRSLTQEK